MPDSKQSTSRDSRPARRSKLDTIEVPLPMGMSFRCNSVRGSATARATTSVTARSRLTVRELVDLGTIDVAEVQASSTPFVVTPRLGVLV